MEDKWSQYWRAKCPQVQFTVTLQMDTLTDCDDVSVQNISSTWEDNVKGQSVSSGVQADAVPCTSHETQTEIVHATVCYSYYCFSCSACLSVSSF
jgi:hypothetical protein